MADNFRFAQLQNFFLAGSGAISGATSITLKSMTTIDGAALTMAGTFGDIGYGTLEPGNGTQEEQISFTGLTNNANGTVTLTGVKTVLDVYPYTEVSGLAKTHPGSSVFVISNTAGFYNKFVAKDNDGVINETLTFTDPNIPEMNANNVISIDDAQFITKYHFDTNGGNTSNFNRMVVAGTAGETISAGNAIYLDPTDQEWKLTDADTASTVNNVLLGIAQGAGTDGNPITNGVLIYGLDSNQTGLIAGKQYFSNTAGGFSNSAGTTEVTAGISTSATTILFYPRYDQQITEDQQDALAGTEGIPNTANPYATKTTTDKKLSQTGAEIYAASSAGTDTYAITLSPVPSAYTTGMVVNFKADVGNTGACTLNVNSLGAKSIKKNITDDLSDGDILADQIVTVIYDGTNFQMQSQISPATLGNFTVNADETSSTYFTTIMSLPYEGGAGHIPAGWTIPSSNPDNQIKTGFGVIYSSFNSGGGYLPNIGFGSSGAGLSLGWANTKIYRIKFVAACASQGGGDDMGLGFVDSSQTSTLSDSTSVQRAIKLVFTGTTDLAFVTGDGTSNQTQTTSSISIDDLNLYEIIWIPGVSAQLYVNGTLLFTNSTVLPTSGGSTVAFGFGNNSLNGVLVISNPTISIEL